MDRKQILDSLKEEMIGTLREVLRYETITTDALPGMPFGKNNADCLAYVLKKAKKWALSRTTATTMPDTSISNPPTKTRRFSACWVISTSFP